MNILKITKAVVENTLFMKGLTRDFKDPVLLTETELLSVFDSLRNDRIMANRFATAVNITNWKVLFEHNMSVYLNYKGAFSVEKFFLHIIHPDYIVDYLKWVEAAYSYTIAMRDVVEPLRQTYRITVPMKLKSGSYYWILQESSALQLDSDKNMISHINIYSLVRPFDPKEQLSLIGDMWDAHYRQEEWSSALLRLRSMRQPFILTPEQKRIVALLFENSELTNQQIAQKLGKQKSTIDTQNKQILNRTRESFPNHDLKNIKDAVALLALMNILQERYIHQGYED
jgi:DNA-binding CsgD family transcriptional regulator